ncbi:MAG: lipase family protein [Bacteroidota bacterium]
MMKHTFFFFFLLVILTPTYAIPGKLNSYKLIHSYSIPELDSIWKNKKINKFMAKINYPIDVFEVIYETTWHDGTSVEASGIFFLPRKKEKEFPMICYHHGTQVVKERNIAFTGEQAICIAFSTSGYMVAFPDYIGLGNSKKTHLYLHVETEAAASIDLLRAVKELIVKEDAKQSKYLFLTGYSQGGHSTLATLKVMQEKYPTEFNVTASAPMSGAYDLGGVQSEVMFKPYSHPGYLPYLMYSYQEVYKCFKDENCSFKAPYAAMLPPLYDGKHSMSDINKVMPEVPKDILTDEFLLGLSSNEKFPFKLAIAENSVHNWKPETPVLFCYCKADEQVNYKNAIIASDVMKSKGAKNIKLRHTSRKMGHRTCAVFSSVYAKMYFDSFVKGSKKGRKGPLINRMAISLAKIKVKK